jgi:VanZ family protein
MSKGIRIILVLFWIFFIFILLTLQLPAYQGQGLPGADKLVHLFLFGILSLLIIYSLIEKRKEKFLLVFLFSFLISGMYAAFMEYLQSFIPTRAASEYDFLAGLIGIILAEAIAYKIYVSQKT